MSTRLLIQTGSKTQVARDWRVVNIPEEDVRRTDIFRLYVRIVEHTFDSLEPYSPPVGSKDAPVRALIGKTQNAKDFQDIPLNVCVADAVALFEVYIKFMIVLAEDEAAVHIPSEDSRRNAFEVRRIYRSVAILTWIYDIYVCAEIDIDVFPKGVVPTCRSFSRVNSSI